MRGNQITCFVGSVFATHLPTLVQAFEFAFNKKADTGPFAHATEGVSIERSVEMRHHRNDHLTVCRPLFTAPFNNLSICSLPTFISSVALDSKGVTRLLTLKYETRS